MSGFLFKAVAAVAAGDTYAALALGNADCSSTAGTAEEGVFLSLTEAVAPQGDPVKKALLFAKIPLVFQLSARYAAREHTAVAPDDRRDRQGKKKIRDDSVPHRSEKDGQKHDHTCADRKEAAKGVSAVATFHKTKTGLRPRIKTPQESSLQILQLTVHLITNS